jgi:hypothetical protein
VCVRERNFAHLNLNPGFATACKYVYNFALAFRLFIEVCLLFAVL